MKPEEGTQFEEMVGYLALLTIILIILHVLFRT